MEKKKIKYRKRIADELLNTKLEGKGAVLIEGPKWCGKTTTAEQTAKSVIYLNESERGTMNSVLAELNPKQILTGKTPRLIDEWQLAPRLWDAVRFEVDHREELGQFILTGSSVPADTSEIKHTGTGRFSWLLMRTMSLYESGDSTGSVSLKSLFDGENEVEGESDIDIDYLAFLVCRGGWPKALEMEDRIALNQANDYFDAMVHADISRVDGIRRSPEKAKAFMRSYSRNLGSQASYSVITKDISDNSNISISSETVSSYADALRRIFVIEDMAAWNPNLKTKTAIRTSNTHYFVDPSIAAASLGIGPGDLVNDLQTFGFLFETLSVRDLRIFADSIDGKIYHYHDKENLECDAVIHLRNGKYGLVEVKLGGDSAIEAAARNLLKLKSKLDTTKMKDPSFLLVLTGIGKYPYRRRDGVFVIPAGCLKN